MRYGKLVTLFFLLLLMLAGGMFAIVGNSTAETRSGIDYVNGYRSWTRITPALYRLPARALTACAAPMQPGPTEAQIKSGDVDHDEFAYISVYANPPARHAMMEEKSPKFPEGSVIVKEKYRADDTLHPTLSTVMIKHARGYNPSVGDWEFMVVDGPAKKVMARGKLGHCQSCHAGMGNNDFISRAYLSAAVEEKMK
jgi:hypothetical protein